tara:strand:+ start:1152 stop:2333 length:1182 start_codon:yes stop_codon:yes gene_type:complete
MKAHFWDRAKNILEPDMFPREWMPVVSSLFYAQKHYESDITVDELLSVHRDLNPALPESTKESTESLIHSLAEVDLPNRDIAFDVIKNFWRRDKAKHIGNKALAIWTGEGGDFAELQRLIDLAASEDVNSHETFSIVNEDLEELVKYTQRPSEFKFTLEQMSARITGMNRGDLGIIFARPEVGKTTFCCFLVAEYIRQGHSVFYWANEERASKIKLRIITSYLKKSVQDVESDIENSLENWAKVRDNLVVFDSVGTSIEELDSYCGLNKPSVVIIDQLDKMKIIGQFGRGDERLKALYCYAREVAKRNDCLVWAVSQAGFEADGNQIIDYSMLDGSKTGKAGEADIILGIGKNADDEDTTRFINVSKNKINGFHGFITVDINKDVGRYYDSND